MMPLSTMLALADDCRRAIPPEIAVVVRPSQPDTGNAWVSEIRAVVATWEEGWQLAYLLEVDRAIARGESFEAACLDVYGRLKEEMRARQHET